VTFFRYLAVQLIAYAVDLGVFVLLFETGLASPIPANVAAKIAAGTLAFAAHRHYTFRAGSSQRVGREAMKYGTLLALNVPVASGLLAALMQVIAHPTAAKIIADVACVLATFLLTRHGVFGRVGGEAPGNGGVRADR